MKPGKPKATPAPSKAAAAAAGTAAAKKPKRKRPADEWGAGGPVFEGSLFDGVPLRKRRKEAAQARQAKAKAAAVAAKSRPPPARPPHGGATAERRGDAYRADPGSDDEEDEDDADADDPVAERRRQRAAKEAKAAQWAEAQSFDPWAQTRQKSAGQPGSSAPAAPAPTPTAGRPVTWVALAQPPPLPPPGVMTLKFVEFGPPPSFPAVGSHKNETPEALERRVVLWQNCPAGARDKHARQLYGQALPADAVEYVKWKRRATDFNPRGGVCLVTFQSEEMAEYAASLPPPTIDGHEVEVRWLGLPAVTGQDDAVAAVRAMLAGRQWRIQASRDRREPAPLPGALFFRLAHWGPAELKRRAFKRRFPHVLKAPKGTAPPAHLKAVQTAGPAQPFLAQLDHVDFGGAVMKLVREAQPAGCTPMQAAVWPQLVAGHSCAAVLPHVLDSPLCYALPALLQARVQKPRPEGFEGPVALFLVPGASDAWRVGQALQRYTFDIALWVLQDCAGHDAMFWKQAQRLSRGVDVLVASPELAVEYIEAGVVGVRRVTFLALDQFHVLALRFRHHLAFLRRVVRPDCQTFVATKAAGLDAAAPWLTPGPAVRLTFPPDFGP
eukprot:EG_transcript_5208